MTALEVCAYAAPYEGNFMNSLLALKNGMLLHGHKMIFAFPKTAANITWVKKLQNDCVIYFLPLSKAYVTPETYMMLRRIYKEHPDIEIVHSHFELYDIPVVCTAPKNVKVFWHLHDAIEAYSDLKNKLLCKLQYGVFHGRAELLSVSKVHTQYAVKLGFPKTQVRYFPNGIDTGRIKRIDRELDDREFDFLLFGWDYEIKGVDLCIKACESMEKAPCVAIVCNDNTRDRIISEFGKVPQYITLLNPEKDVNRVYSRARCFLHISRFEGLSYALLEAVYAGLPVICSNIEANRFASVFPTVAMVENENVTKISETMEIMRSGFCFFAEKKNYFLKSREIIENEYSVSEWVDRVLECYGIL